MMEGEAVTKQQHVKLEFPVDLLEKLDQALPSKSVTLGVNMHNGHKAHMTMKKTKKSVALDIIQDVVSDQLPWIQDGYCECRVITFDDTLPEMFMPPIKTEIIDDVDLLPADPVAMEMDADDDTYDDAIHASQYVEKEMADRENADISASQTKLVGGQNMCERSKRTKRNKSTPKEGVVFSMITRNSKRKKNSQPCMKQKTKTKVEKTDRKRIIKGRDRRERDVVKKENESKAEEECKSGVCQICNVETINLIMHHQLVHDNVPFVDKIKSKKKRPFKCLLCEKKMVNPRSMRKHIVEYHSKHEKMTESLQALDKEYPLPSGNVATPCSECSFASYGPSILKHMRESHSDIPNFAEKFSLVRRSFLNSKITLHKDRKKKELANKPVCEFCGQRFDSKAGYNRHKHFSCPNNPDKRKLYYCAYCSTTRRTMEDLEQHKKKAHPDGSSYRYCVCDICGKSYSRAGLYNHMRITHNIIKGVPIGSFPCSQCGMVFKFKAQRKVHMAKHSDERNFRCDQCDSTFKTRDGVTRHKKFIHMGLYPYRCTKCGHGVEQKKYLLSHECGRVRGGRTRHKVQSAKQEESSPETPQMSQPTSQSASQQGFQQTSRDTSKQTLQVIFAEQISEDTSQSQETSQQASQDTSKQILQGMLSQQTSQQTFSHASQQVLQQSSQQTSQDIPKQTLQGILLQQASQVTSAQTSQQMSEQTSQQVSQEASNQASQQESQQTLPHASQVTFQQTSQKMSSDVTSDSTESEVKPEDRTLQVQSGEVSATANTEYIVIYEDEHGVQHSLRTPYPSLLSKIEENLGSTVPMVIESTVLAERVQPQIQNQTFYQTQ